MAAKNQGGAGIRYVPNYGNTTSGINPNSSNAYRAASVYTLPYRDSVVTQYDISNAAAANARLIAEALERARKAREEAIRRAREEAERKAAEFAKRERERAEASAAQATAGVAGPIPVEPGSGSRQLGWNPNRTEGVSITDPGMGTGPGVGVASNFRTDNLQVAEALAKSKGMYVLPVETLVNGRTLYTITPEDPKTRGMGPGRTAATGANLVPAASYRASADAMEAMYRSRREGLTQAREGDLTEDILIQSWRDADPEAITRMLDQRYYNKAVDVWGTPSEVVEKQLVGQDEYGNPIYEERVVDIDWTYKLDEETGERLGGRPVSYLGMSPERGKEFLLSVNLPRVPGPDADITEWRRFLNSVDTGFIAPKYMPESVYSTLQWMPIQDRIRMQKKFVAAGLYETNDPIKFGRISPEDNAIMTGLMSMANQQGITWEQALDESIMLADRAKAQAASYGGGGGGGGGATTTYKQIQYNQTSVAQARSLLIGVLTEALGRYPTDKEVQEFLDIVNKKEKKSPSKTVTETTTSGSTTTAVSRMTPSTVDVQSLAEDFARGIDGYEENAVDRYLNALLESMGGVSA